VVIGLDEQVGHDILVGGVFEIAAGAGVELEQLFAGRLDGVKVVTGAAFDDRQAVLGQVFEVRLDEGDQQVAVGGVGINLQQEAFLQIAGSDAPRIELLHQIERLLGDGRGDLRGGELERVGPQQLVERAGQPSVGIEVLHEELGEGPHGGRAVEEVQLLEQVFLQ
jgi:hypothetical protein